MKTGNDAYINHQEPKESSSKSAPAHPAKQQSPGNHIHGLLQKMQNEIRDALPNVGITPERITRLALTTIRRNPALAACTEQSLLGAIMQAAQLGLEVGIDGQAYLVPFKDNKAGCLECTFILGYRGMIELMYRNPRVKKVFANAVYENDDFELRYGSDERFSHVPASSGRGKIAKYYAYAKLDGGDNVFVVMSREDVERHASKNSKNYDANSSPWKSDFDAMALKTCIRRLSTWVPKSSDIRDALQSDETVMNYKNGSLDPRMEI